MLFKDGNKVKRNTVIAKIYGSTLSILKAERTALNFISHLSGIATCTNELLNLISRKRFSKKLILLDTRKTTPNLRELEKQAVRAGGGRNHRMNLSSMILIKDNHINVAGSVKNAFSKVLQKYGCKFKIEIEVRNMKELKEAISCKPDVIMFDNWNVKKLKKVLKFFPKHIKIEVSGQINKKNISHYASLGADYISTSYMIKNSKWTDFSLDAV